MGARGFLNQLYALSAARRMAGGPLAVEMGLCRGVRALVHRVGSNRIGRRPGDADLLPSAARYRGVGLSSGRPQVHQRTVRAARAVSTIGDFRCRLQGGTGSRTDSGSLGASCFRLALDVSFDWHGRNAVAAAMAAAVSRALARGQRTACAAEWEGTTRNSAQPQRVGNVSGLLLLELLLVSAHQLGAFLSVHGARH